MCPKLTSKQREILVGLILGDGHLVTWSKKTYGKKAGTYKLVVLQSDMHKDYLFHLYEIFKPLTKSPPRFYVFSDKRNQAKIYTSL